METWSINGMHCAPKTQCTFVWLVSNHPGSNVTDASIRLLAALLFLSPSPIWYLFFSLHPCFFLFSSFHPSPWSYFSLFTDAHPFLLEPHLPCTCPFPPLKAAGSSFKIPSSPPPPSVAERAAPPPHLRLGALDNHSCLVSSQKLQTTILTTFKKTKTHKQNKIQSFPLEKDGRSNAHASEVTENLASSRSGAVLGGWRVAPQGPSGSD